MSNLLVQNIKHTNNTTAQTIDTSGRTTVSIMNNDSTNRSDGGAVIQNLVQGLCKGFLLHQNKTSNTTHHSLNVTSVTDLGTAEIRVAHTQNMSSADKTIIVGGVAAGVYNGTCMMPSDTGADGEYEVSTSQYHITIRGNDNISKVDCHRIPVCIFGDLA